MRRLWCDAESSFEGEFWSLAPSRAFPKPVQQPHPPIHVAGETDAALRRVVRLRADWIPFNITPEALARRRADLARLLEPEGRSIDDVHITAGGPNRAAADALDPAAFEEAGADQVLLRIPPTVAPEAVADELDAMATAAGF